MHWYGGSIAEAVTLSKQKNAIFVVFVEGDNDLSQEMAATIDESAVVSRLSDLSNFLAIKLKSGSSNYTHFAQIYQFVPVPSLFFIGRNGTPLEVVCAGVQSDNLAVRIDRILEEHRKEKSSPVQASTSSQNIKEQTVNLLQSEATVNVGNHNAGTKHGSPVNDEPETSSGPAAKIPKTEQHEQSKSGQEYEVVCDGDVCVRRPAAGPSHVPAPTPSPTPTPAPAPATEPALSTDAQPEPEPVPMETQPVTAESTASIEEKLERAKELIEARRREKADKEKELERQREKERRSAGKGMAELKQWQAEQELKQVQEERRREKMENDRARQRILEQIAQDRAERRARDVPAPVPAPTPTPTPSNNPTTAHTSGDAGGAGGVGGAGGARVQFKLPDGGSHTAHFQAEHTLDDLRRYVTDNLHFTSFSLWTAFPRRELEGRGATVRALGLAPSAALLVLPAAASASPPTVATPSSLSTLITFFTQLFTSFILEPSQQVYTWIRSRLFPPPNNPRSPSPPRASPPPPGVRRRGNIHRIPGERGGDDDNNTWNGNSTQQM